ncbi:MAG: non-heme chloroperoxidase [Acidimicrobiaceae bacterium]|nr:non-heme chloroperoxidase [Acidimicrobiaceae bacterium]
MPDDAARPRLQGGRLVLLHGMGQDHSQFDGVAPLLADRDVEVVTPDLMGLSLAAMVDEVRPHVTDGAVVGGVSMGAAVSLAYAVQPDARCSALVQIGPAFDGSSRAPEGARGYLDWLADTLEAGGFDALRAAGEPMADFWAARFPPEHLLALWRDLSVGMPVPDPADVRVPALVIAWPDDGLHPMEVARSLAARLPDAELVEVPFPADLQLPAAPIATALLDLFHSSR